VIILFGPPVTFLPTDYAVNEEVVARKGDRRLPEGGGACLACEADFERVAAQNVGLRLTGYPRARKVGLG
jgi:hypothetical protein